MKGKKAEKRVLILLLGVFLILLPGLGYSEIPKQINYQGYLTSTAGGPVNGSEQMVFSIYTAASGGSALWTETQAVVLARGIYNVVLGESPSNPLNLPFDNPYYLGVKVGTDPEMTPRLPLTSVGYAYRAYVTDTVIGTGNFSNPIISTVATGTAPLQVSSMTQTINLNADLLDGKHDYDFAPAAHGHDDRYYLKDYVNALEARIAALEAKLSGLTRSGNDFIITNANLYIQSGSGTTGGTINGKGNLIIGYNELRGSGNDRTGSHNLIVGRQQNYSSYGGMVAGYDSTISGPYASVSGGYSNTASGSESSVSGGVLNVASGSQSSVSGGHGNTAYNEKSSVSGGLSNTASGPYSSVSGGNSNTASGSESSVSGGYSNTASGIQSSVSGGAYNTAYNEKSSVSGGLFNDASGYESSVSGGAYNTASGFGSSVSGGYLNTASGYESSVSGGNGNTASGYGSSVSGGSNRSVNGDYNWRAGGYFQDF
jgi:hypothetical protein